MNNENFYTCPVCAYDRLDEPAYDEHGCASFGICPSCGTEFGYDDNDTEHTRLRSAWVSNGMKWWSNSTKPPADWEPARLLEKAGL